jgi:uncharacterized BrkB/YihY/UPF0761 family membrane protein
MRKKMKMGFLPALTLLFIALKLTNVIAWSWWLVLLPLYGVFVIVFIWVIFWVMYLIHKDNKRKKVRR